MRAWLDAHALPATAEGDDRIDWPRIVPFLALHVAVLAVFLVGFSWIALWTAVGLYLVRMFAITAFYHRYFSHRAFRTSRPLQFLFAFLAATSAQRGPLWWAAHHRKHHRLADRAGDPHSPREGFWHSHVAWFLKRRAFATDLAAVPDLARYPELRWLDRFDVVAPATLAVALFLAGEWLAWRAPELGTDGWQLLVWGFVISTVALFHATFTINSLAHRYGRRRFPTRDDSRNNLWLALLTLGEGWHNNHHYCPGAARQGFRWWEIDPTYWLLRLLAAFGLIWDLKPVPAALRR
ncbi:MAG: acyl-CoA desaturase [Xanthomonadales bacterium]|nr:acyl-CoA desaturase [Xanthomonadales bacterium]